MVIENAPLSKVTRSRFARLGITIKLTLIPYPYEGWAVELWKGVYTSNSIGSIGYDEIRDPYGMFWNTLIANSRNPFYLWLNTEKECYEYLPEYEAQRKAWNDKYP